MSTKINLEIIKYLPEDNDLVFNFRADDKASDQIIHYNNKKTINFTLQNLRKEFKITIRVNKNNTSIGICDFVISQLMFLKREENLSKTLLINDFIKKSSIGKLIIKILINYPDSSTNKLPKEILTKEYMRSSSATPIDTKFPHKNYYTHHYGNNKTNIGSGLKNLKNLINSVNSNFNTFYIKKNSNKKNVHQGILGNKIKDKFNTNTNVLSSANKSLDSIKVEELHQIEDIDKSRIDEIFEESNDLEINSIGNKINDFILEFKEKFTHELENNFDKLDEIDKESCRAIGNKLFELQKLYYGDYNTISKLYESFKGFLIEYSDQYRNLMKKTNRLNEAFESFNLKNEFASSINREENKRINEAVTINRNELKIYKNIFGIEYQLKDIIKYKADIEADKYENQKKSLLKALEIISKDGIKIDKLDDSKKELLISLASKFGIKLNQNLFEKVIVTNEKKLEINLNNDSSIKLDNDINNKGHVIHPSLIGNKADQKLVSIFPEKYVETDIPNSLEGFIHLGFRENGSEKQESQNVNSNESPNKKNDLISDFQNTNLEDKECIKPILNESIKTGKIISTTEQLSIENISLKQNYNTCNLIEKNSCLNIINSSPLLSNENKNLINFQPIDIPEFKTEENKKLSLKSYNNNITNQPSVNAHKKRLTIVNSQTEDETDQKLDDYLITTYNKKKMSYIPMRRVSENNYEFGTQKIEIKIDEGIIRVKTGGGYILLDKFIDAYGGIEESIMIQASLGNNNNRTVTITKNGRSKKSKQDQENNQKVITKIKDKEKNKTLNNKH